MEEEFYLSRDDDGHWYIVPADKEGEWEDWLSLNPDDEASWEAPEWAFPIGGAISLVKFSNYRLY